MTSLRYRRRALGAMMLLSLGAAACGSPASDTPANEATPAPTATPADDSSETVDDAIGDGAATTNAPAADTGAPAPVGDANTRLNGEFGTLDGATVNLAEFHSEDLVLWMWAPW